MKSMPGDCRWGGTASALISGSRCLLKTLVVEEQFAAACSTGASLTTIRQPLEACEIIRRTALSEAVSARKRPISNHLAADFSNLTLCESFALLLTVRHPARKPRES